MMLETLTKSGAVIHTDPDNPTQAVMLAVAIAAFGGLATQEAVADHGGLAD